MPSVFRAGLMLLALAVGASGARAQSLSIPRAVREAADRIRAPQLARDLAYLSSDALLGRNTPSPGLDSAAAFIARRLRQAGLQPLGDGGTYFQQYELHQERLDTAGAYLQIGGTRFRFGGGFVMTSFTGSLSGTFPVVYVGHGWTLPEDGIDPWAGIETRGKLVVVSRRTPPATVPIRRIGRIAVNGRSPMAEAERHGAVGILYLPDEAGGTQWNRLRTASLQRLELHPPVPSAYAAPPVTSLMLAPGVAKALLAGEREADTASRPVSFQLAKPVRIELPLASRQVHRPSNVVALIEGTDPVRRNEYVTIASHLDGAVGRAPERGDSIYNAADDNATGSAATLAIAEQMMRAPRPRRSVVFIWDSGEERGLWGTRRFVHQPPVPLDRIVAHFNVDMIGANRAPGFADSASTEATGPNEVYLVGPGVLSPTVDTLLQRVNQSYLGLVYNRAYDRPGNQFFYPRTDAGPFLERGILTIGYFTGLHDRYHAPSDEARYLDPAKMERIAKTILVSLWMLADGDQQPSIETPLPPHVPRYGRAVP